MTQPTNQDHARCVTVKKYAQMSGLSEEAVRKRVQRGIWLEGKEWHRGRDGRIWIDTRGVDSWVMQTA